MYITLWEGQGYARLSQCSLHHESQVTVQTLTLGFCSINPIEYSENQGAVTKFFETDLWFRPVQYLTMFNGGGK